jgi:hypothetical protein
LIAPSDGFEFEAFADKLDRFGQGRNTEAEGALDNAGFAAGSGANRASWSL